MIAALRSPLSIRTPWGSLRKFANYPVMVNYNLRQGVLMNKRLVFMGFVILIVGVMPLLNSLSNPRTQALHGSDFVQLIASGVCFGAGFAVLVGALRRRAK